MQEIYDIETSLIQAGYFENMYEIIEIFIHKSGNIFWEMEPFAPYDCEEDDFHDHCRGNRVWSG